MNTQTFYDLGLRGYFEYGSNVVYTYKKNSYEYNESDYVGVSLAYEKGSDRVYVEFYLLQGPNNPVSILLTKNGSSINNHSDYIKTCRITVTKLTNGVRLNPVLVFRYKPDFIDKEYKLKNLRFSLKRGYQDEVVTTNSYVVTATSDLMLVDTYRTLKVNNTSKYLSQLTFNAEGIDYATMRSRQVLINFEDKYVNVEPTSRVTPKYTFTFRNVFEKLLPPNVNGEFNFKVYFKSRVGETKIFNGKITHDNYYFSGNPASDLTRYYSKDNGNTTVNMSVKTEFTYFRSGSEYVSGFDEDTEITQVDIIFKDPSTSPHTTQNVALSLLEVTPNTIVGAPTSRSYTRRNFTEYTYTLNFKNFKLRPYHNNDILFDLRWKDSTKSPYPNVTIGMDNMSTIPIGIHVKFPNNFNLGNDSSELGSVKFTLNTQNSITGTFNPGSTVNSDGLYIYKANLRVHKDLLPEMASGRIHGVELKYRGSPPLTLTSITFDGVKQNATSNKRIKSTLRSGKSYLNLELPPDVVNSRILLDKEIILRVDMENLSVQSNLTGRFDISDYTTSSLTPLTTTGAPEFRSLDSFTIVQSGVFTPHLNQYDVRVLMKPRNQVSGSYATAYDQYFPHLYKRLVVNGVEINQDLEPMDGISFVEVNKRSSSEFINSNGQRIYLHVYDSNTIMSESDPPRKQYHYSDEHPIRPINYGFNWYTKSDRTRFRFTPTDTHVSAITLSGSYRRVNTRAAAILQESVAPHHILRYPQEISHEFTANGGNPLRIGFGLDDFGMSFGLGVLNKAYALALTQTLAFRFKITDLTGNGFQIKEITNDNGYKFRSYHIHTHNEGTGDHQGTEYIQGIQVFSELSREDSILISSTAGIRVYGEAVFNVVIPIANSTPLLSVMDYNRQCLDQAFFIDSIAEITGNPYRSRHDSQFVFELMYNEEQAFRSLKIIPYEGSNS